MSRTEKPTPRPRVVYVSGETHRRLRILAARRGRPLGKVVEDLIEQEIAESANPWINSGGLALQEKALREVWSDPSLDVYDD